MQHGLINYAFNDSPSHRSEASNSSEIYSSIPGLMPGAMSNLTSRSRKNQSSIGPIPIYLIHGVTIVYSSSKETKEDQLNTISHKRSHMNTHSVTLIMLEGHLGNVSPGSMACLTSGMTFLKLSGMSGGRHSLLGDQHFSMQLKILIL